MKQPLTKHMVVISFDCLSSLDFPLLRQLPHFSALLKEAAYAEHVEAIYPSVTYPSHTSIVTGNFPARHGITSNTLLQPGRYMSDWHWYRRDVKGTTLYDEAKKANLTTAALLWPVTAKAKIDYNMPEIFANRPWKNQIFTSLFSGTPLYQLDMNRRFGHIRQGVQQPALDEFVLASAVHTLETKKPNLSLIHFTDLDTQRHVYGFSSKQAIDAIHRHDERLGKIIAALKNAGMYEDTTIIALGDHSSLDESDAISLNVLFREHGLLTVNEKEKVTSWKAYCKSCEGSAYIYVKDEKDTATKEKITALVENLLQDSNSGVAFALTGEEAAKRGADGSCLFMLEAKVGYYFLEDWTGPYLRQITQEDAKKNKMYTLATHGYSPTKEAYTTVFIATGKGIKNGAIVPHMRLVDEGPTLAHMLGLHLGDTDGKVIEEFFA